MSWEVAAESKSFGAPFEPKPNASVALASCLSSIQRDLRLSELLALRMTLRGQSLKQVAFELEISDALACRIRQTALAKVGVRSVWQFVMACAAGSIAGFEYPSHSPPPRLSELTPAERGVARQVVLGRSNAAIARERGTAERTVANQVSSLFRKLGVQSRIELALVMASTLLAANDTEARWLANVRASRPPPP